MPDPFLFYSDRRFYDYKLSMYFSYTNAQNYTRTLTQGVNLTDNRSLAMNYKRTEIQTVGVDSILGKLKTIYRKCVMTVHNTMMIQSFPLYIRKVLEHINVVINKVEKMSFLRKSTDVVSGYSETHRNNFVLRNIQVGLKTLDSQCYTELFIRSVRDIETTTDFMNNFWLFIRGIFSTAGSIAEPTHKAEYKRYTTDTVIAEGNVKMSLFLCIRILTQVIIRDYILRRFLIAREQLFLKSPICRELILDSKVK